MEFLTRRLKSYFFWGLCAVLLCWHSMQPEVIDQKIRNDTIKISKEKIKIASGYFDANSKCNDGWQSSSSGPGSCSWHGGVDYDYYNKRSDSYRIVNQNINQLKQKYEDAVERKLKVYFIFIFLFAPALDLIIFQRKFLYSEKKPYPIPLKHPPLQPKTTTPIPPLGFTKQQTINTQSCPLCGAEMHIRKARKGRFKGKQFLGCSKYPWCRGTRSLS